jgi:hypothetical protein
MVTTAMTAVTPTIIPIKVSAVRNLFCRRLPAATRKASQRVETRRPTEFRNLGRVGSITTGLLSARDI